MSINLPNFLIVGAAKSGTTSLFDQLCRHPEVFEPYIKEPGFFIPLNQYSSISNWKDYQKIFKGAEDSKAIGEASVTYLFDPKSPELIKDKLGEDVKILIILRNPIDMSHSLWLHRKRDMKEDLSFFDALEKRDTYKNDRETNSNTIEYDWDYLNRAKFYEQVKRYTDHFKNVKVLIFENYVKNVDEEFPRICEYLGINSNVKIDLQAKNTAYKPKFSLIQKLLTYQLSFKDTLKKFLPHSWLVKLKSSVESLNQEEINKEALSPEERLKLVPLFAEDVKSLSVLLNIDLGEYWKDFS